MSNETNRLYGLLMPRLEELERFIAESKRVVYAIPLVRHVSIKRLYLPRHWAVKPGYFRLHNVRSRAEELGSEVAYPLWIGREIAYYRDLRGQIHFFPGRDRQVPINPDNSVYRKSGCKP